MLTYLWAGYTLLLRAEIQTKTENTDLYRSFFFSFYRSFFSGQRVQNKWNIRFEPWQKSIKTTSCLPSILDRVWSSGRKKSFQCLENPSPLLLGSLSHSYKKNNNDDLSGKCVFTREVWLSPDYSLTFQKKDTGSFFSVKEVVHKSKRAREMLIWLLISMNNNVRCANVYWMLFINECYYRLWIIFRFKGRLSF